LALPGAELPTLLLPICIFLLAAAAALPALSAATTSASVRVILISRSTMSGGNDTKSNFETALHTASVVFFIFRRTRAMADAAWGVAAAADTDE
jgi:hypothetical protein